jgi:N-acetyl-anhydromuramyl-L-alanine amidase AmpD
MNLIPTNLHFQGTLVERSKTNYIVVHHLEGNSDVYSTHVQHLTQDGLDKKGIAYHFYVAKNGDVYIARPEWSIGSHARSANKDSIGVVFQGNFIHEQMESLQYDSGIALLKWLKSKYGNIPVIGHREMMTSSTDCPGKLFPLEQMKRQSEVTVETPNLTPSPTEQRKDNTVWLIAAAIAALILMLIFSKK